MTVKVFRHLRDVHCRTGSLEMRGRLIWQIKNVHCRTGSLEIRIHQQPGHWRVHCRTGSLERFVPGHRWSRFVHCRTGSLERCRKCLTSGNAVHCRIGSLEKSMISCVMLPIRPLRYALPSHSGHGRTGRRRGGVWWGCVITSRARRCASRPDWRWR